MLTTPIVFWGLQDATFFWQQGWRQLFQTQNGNRFRATIFATIFCDDFCSYCFPSKKLSEKIVEKLSPETKKNVALHEPAPELLCHHMWPQSLNVSQLPVCERCPLPAKLESNPAPYREVIGF